ncbi:MAG TPA: hypothetical protein VMU95_06820 [Trebonia sp.]|nr:hypothetical protein [Trebonia sp.]
MVMALHPAATADAQAADALAWSVTAMSGALRRLASAPAEDAPQAVAAATEAIWWTTEVNSAMSRHHPAAYGHALAALDPSERKAVDTSLAGLRFVRGQLGHCNDPADFIEPRPASGASRGADWTWSALPPPSAQRGRSRDAGPYREYRAQLAGRPVSEALRRVAGFLAQAHASASDPGH